MANESGQQTATAEAAAAEHTRSGQIYRPDVDLIERADELVILADMPGVKSNDIDVSFEDGTLRIYGRVTDGRLAREDLLLREYGIGDYYRTFRISEQIDPSRISAEMTNGVLALHLPKAETAKPRKIKVEAK
jgi:HSP20 family molecular chaperone IbpA